MERWFLFTLLALCSAAGVHGICFRFSADSSLQFNQPINVTGSARYRLEFKTTSVNGTLFFAKGPYDFERLFLRNGVLHYFLFNPTPYGVGGTFGTHMKTYLKQGGPGPLVPLPVANNKWHTVEFLRNSRVRGASRMQTGMIFDNSFRYLNSRPRQNVNIHTPIFLGGPEGMASFTGLIRNFREERNNYEFVDTNNIKTEVSIEPNCR